MSKQREAFEAEFAEQEGLLLGRLVSDERYESMTTEWAYRAWQASRAAALEEILRMLTEHKKERGGLVDNGIEDEISALKEQSCGN